MLKSYALIVTIAADLVADASFRPAGSIDSDVPPSSGVYAVGLRSGAALPEPFESVLKARPSRLIYIGEATSLKRRMLGNELRGRGHGTFFRSIGAVLGYRPQASSLATKRNKRNYTFTQPDVASIVVWINGNLEVSWREVPLTHMHTEESSLIAKHTPLLNLKGNPLRLAELTELRSLCRTIAMGPVSAL